VVLRRAGMRTLSLTPGIDLTRLGRAVRALEPRAVVLTGRRVSLDSIGRLVYAIRSVAREVVVFDYRGAVPDTGASTVHRLGDSPLAARDGLLARLTPASQQPAVRLGAIAAGQRRA
jgi:MerR family transcriptional regulator, light-induced transcriptional regulator